MLSAILITHYLVFYPLCIDYPYETNITCIDSLSEEHYRHNFDYLNKKYKGKETFVQGDVQKMDFPEGNFDMVFAGQLIEHLPEPDSFLAEAYRVLKVGGILNIDTPNRLMTDIISEITRRQTTDESWFHGKEVGHVREFRPKEMVRLLRGHGFKIRKKVGIYTDLGTYLFRKDWPSDAFYDSKAFRLLSTRISRFLPSISYPFWLEAEKV